MKQFWNILKYFGISAGTVGILFGAFSFFDNMQDDISEIKTMIDYNNIQINDVSNQLYSLQDTADKIQAMGEKNGRDIQTLKWGLQHFNDFDPEQFEDIIEEMLKKNIGLSSLPRWELDNDLTRFVTEPSPDLIEDQLNLSQ